MFWRTARYTRTVTLFPYTTRFRCIVAVPPQVEPAADSETEGVGRHPPVEIGPALGEPCGEVEIGLRPEQRRRRSEEHTSELQSLMRISYAVFCLKKENQIQTSSTQSSHVAPSPH